MLSKQNCLKLEIILLSYFIVNRFSLKMCKERVTFSL
jgi:hypothetical protein